MNKSGRDGAVQASAKNHRAAAVSERPSARRGTVNARTYSAQDIKDRLHSGHILTICQNWLPDGKRMGSWWVCKCPWRDDKKPSFGVSLTTGRWRDFARDEGGDVFDLTMRLFKVDMREAMDSFRQMLGLQ